MEALPIALIAKIFDTLTLRDALHASFVSHGWRSVLNPYLRDTYNIYKYLSCFLDPKSVLRVFRRTGAVLSGSRGLAYFLPSHRVFTNSSDWDIFVPHPNYYNVHEELLSQGFIFVPRTKPQLTPEHFLVYTYYNAAKEKVQLVALTRERTLYDCLMDFHHSLVQNFISGWGAYSIQWESTFNRAGWMAKRLDPYPKYQEEEIQKYDRRGFRVVRWLDRHLVSQGEQNIFAVYWPMKQSVCGQTYLSFEELELELSIRQPPCVQE